MTNFDFSEKILELLQAKQYIPLQRYLETLNPADIAECMIDLLDEEDLDDKSLLRLFRLLPKELAADTFAEMDPDLQEKLITGFTDKELSEVFEEMFLDDTVDVIEEMPASVTLDRSLVGDFAQEDKLYTLCEFFTGQVVENIRVGDTVAFGSVPPHGCALIKVMVQNSNWPQIIKSTGHFSFGGEAECYLCKHGKLVFEVDWKFPCPVSYTVRLPKDYVVPALPENVTYSADDHCLTFDLPGADKYRFAL